MKQSIQTYKRFVFLSVLSFFMVWYFSFGFGNWAAQETRAAANAWIGGATGDWNDNANWSDGIPTSDDAVTIVSSTGGVEVTLQTGQTATFATLVIGGDATYNVTTTLIGNIASGAGSITIDNNGFLKQKNTVQQVLTGDLTVLSGGTLTHEENATTHVYSVNFSAEDIDIQSGGSIDVDSRGYGGGGKWDTGKGPAGGTIGNGGSYLRGAGGGFGGNGGNAYAAITSGVGGTGYCDITAPSSPGSEGGGGGDNFGTEYLGGDGGGVILLVASGTATINGTVTADGQHGYSSTGGGGNDSGGGAGGTISITSGVISGTPQSITSNGGWSGDGASYEGLGGGGGGGCVLMNYTTSNSVVYTQVNALGGKGSQYGGAGFVYLKPTSGNGNLYAINITTSTATAPSYQNTSALSVDSLNLVSSSIYVVSSTLASSLTIGETTPIAIGDGTGTLRVEGGTLTLNTSPTITQATLELWQPATVSNTSTLTLNIGSGGTLDLRYFTTSSPFSLSSLSVLSGGTVTHGANTTAQTHVVNIEAATVSVAFGGTITATEKGYAGGAAFTDGNGPGPGIYTSLGANGGGSGGAHAGNGGSGGDGSGTFAGGTAYCTTSTPSTLGSGGGGAAQAGYSGGDGGGFIKIATTGDITISGTVDANGGDGDEIVDRDGGGGAGGGMYLSGDNVSIAGSTVSVAGGNGGTPAYNMGGGGGGGCVYINYSSSYTDTSATTSTAAGSGQTISGTPAGEGSWIVAASNAAPSVTSFTGAQLTNGSGYVMVNTTLTDTDNNTSTLFVDYSTDNGTSWASSTIATVSTTSAIATSTGQISNVTSTSGGNEIYFTWDSRTDGVVSSSQAMIRIIPYDGSVYGSSVSSAVIIIDNINPTVPGNITIESGSSSSIIVTYPSTTSTDDNFNDYRIFYVSSTSVTSNDTAFTSTSDANLTNVSFNGVATTTITGLLPDVQYAVNLWAYDTYGNNASSSLAQTIYTYANVAGTPTITTSSASALNIELDSNSNPAVTTYAIFNETDSIYVGASGLATASAVYQTSSTWEGISATSLSPNTQYQFSIISRNQDGINSATTTASGVYTLAATPSAPTVQTNNATTLKVTPNLNGNPASTDVAIYNVTTGNYINTDGSATASAIFQAASTWGIVTVTGLTTGNNYQFAVYARNGDGIITSVSSSSSELQVISGSNNSGGGGGSIPVIIAPPAPTPAPTPEPTPEPAPEQPIETPDDVEQPIPESPIESPEVSQPKPAPKPAPIETTESIDQQGESNTNTDANTDSSVTTPDIVIPSGNTDQSSENSDTSTITEEPVSVVVISEGKPVNVTNKGSVDVEVTTRYSRILVQSDGKEQVLEKNEVTQSIPWKLEGPDGEKCVTITFYDELGRPATKKVSCVRLDTTPPPQPLVLQVKANVKLTSINSGKIVSISGQSEPGATILFQAHKTGNIEAEVLSNLLKSVVGLPAFAAENYETVADQKGNWSFEFPYGFDSGKYSISVQAKDQAGNVSDTAVANIDVFIDGIESIILGALETLSKIGDGITAVIDNPQVEKVNEKVVAPAVATVGVVNMAASGSQLPQVLIYLKFLFAQPLLLLRRKKHQGWGTVYNAFSKEPVDLATVRLIDAQTSQVVRSQVTDTSGRYYVMTKPGNYILEVDKLGFKKGASDYVKTLASDGQYDRLYHGQKLVIDQNNSEINFSIPIEPLEQQKTSQKIIKEKTFKVAQHAISISGLSATVISVIISPTPQIWMFLIGHIVFLIISKKFSHKKVKDAYGIIVSSDNNKELKNVVIRVFDKAYNKLMNTTISDTKGRYALLVGASSYYVTYEKDGFKKRQSGIIDFSKLKGKSAGGLIKKDQKLTPGEGKEIEEDDISQISPTIKPYHQEPGTDPQQLIKLWKEGKINSQE